MVDMCVAFDSLQNSLRNGGLANSHLERIVEKQYCNQRTAEVLI